MRPFFIAVGIGVTVWLLATHQPMWVCIANVILDALLVLEYLRSKS